MAWDYEKSLGRATQQWDKTESLSISDVTREFDFEQISLLEPRRVTGTHIYVDIANYNSILRSGSMHDEDMVRLLHIFAREAAKIAESDFDAEKIHFQGPRLHAVAYRPVGDEKVMVAKAVLAGLAVKKMASAFNTEFDLSGSDAWKVAAGLDHGTCVATKNGVGGDRELLFLGNAANAAAHTLAKSGIRLTANVRDLLPDEFEDYVSESSDCTYLVSMSASAVEAIAADHGWVWSLETSESRLAELAANNPSGCVSCSVPQTPIDKSKLSLSNTKRVTGVSLFADVDGFTKYIEGLATADDDPEEAVRVFHVLRSEMRHTIVRDFDGLRIQYQGDRVQALCYQPFDDDAAVALKAVKTAAALISVAAQVAPEATGVTEPELPVAIGLAAGAALVTRVGQHGDTDVVSIGGSTATAAAIQERLHGGQIGMDAELWSLLPDYLQAVFKWDATAIAHIAEDLNYDDLITVIESETDDAGSGGVGKAAAAIIGAGVTAGVGAAAHLVAKKRMPSAPVRPWSRG